MEQRLVSGEIQKYQGVNGSIQIQSMDDLARVSKMLSESDYFKDAKDAAKCGVKVLAGAEMGIGAFSAMAGIHIIQGKPTIGAHLMAAAVKRHPNYNYRVLANTPDVCRIEFYERWDGKWDAIGISEFTLENARAAGTQNLNKFARNMLFARAISNGVRWYCPDVFDAPVYTPEEMGAPVDGDGNYIEAHVQPVGLNADVISSDQRKRLFAIAKEHNVGEATLRTIVDDYGFESTKDITRADYDAIIACIEASGKVTAPHT